MARESPQISPELLKMYDKTTLTLIKSTFYRRGDNCDMSFEEYVKTLKKLGFTAGMRIVRRDTSKKWTKTNIRIYDDPIHAKLKNVNIFYRQNNNKLPKKVIITMKNERGDLNE